MLAGQPHQQLRPGGLQHRVHGGVMRARQLGQSPRGLLRHPVRFDASPPSLGWRTHQGGGVKTVEHLAPRRSGGFAILTGQPADKAAVRRGSGQTIPEIAGEDLLQQDRQRPAIDHDVVKGQHTPVPVP